MDQSSKKEIVDIVIVNNWMKQNIKNASRESSQQNSANKPSISVMKNKILILLHWINELHPWVEWQISAISNLSSYMLPKVQNEILHPLDENSC